MNARRSHLQLGSAQRLRRTWLRTGSHSGCLVTIPFTLPRSGAVSLRSPLADTWRMEPKHLTRNELYELAWSKPLSKLAAEFGISSATFTKHVDRLEVPRPPSGYWQQLARGLTPSRTELTAATEDTPLEVVIDPSPPVSTLSAPNPSTPTVRVAETLSKPHPIVTQIRQHLKNHY